jgi:hypothetical protein
MGRAYRYVTRIPAGLRDGPARSVWEGRQRLERFLVALTPLASARAEAVRYAASASLRYEWEGYADGPLDEAAYAEGYLRDHPRTALAPALNLILLHRYRCAFEAVVFERTMWPSGSTISRDAWDAEQDALKGKAADGYMRAWNRLQALNDVVIRAIAEDLDEQPFLYQNAGGQHPRRAK